MCHQKNCWTCIRQCLCVFSSWSICQKSINLSFHGAAGVYLSETHFSVLNISYKLPCGLLKHCVNISFVYLFSVMKTVKWPLKSLCIMYTHRCPCIVYTSTQIVHSHTHTPACSTHKHTHTHVHVLVHKRKYTNPCNNTLDINHVITLLVLNQCTM